MADDLVRDRPHIACPPCTGKQFLFKLAPMTSGQCWTVIGLSFGVLALSELFKLFTRKKGR